MRAAAFAALVLLSCRHAPEVARARSAALTLTRLPGQLFCGEWTRLPVTVHNTSAAALEKGKVWLSYRVRSGASSAAVPGAETPMPSDGPVAPGAEAKLNLRFEVPSQRGTHRFVVDLRDDRGWFHPDDAGLPSFELDCRPLFEGFEVPVADVGLRPPGVAWNVAGEDELNRLQRLIARTLETNRVHFAFQGAPVDGYSAGVRYAQVWARDGATISPFARFVDGPQVLTRWVEALLAVQRPSGELDDWVRDSGEHRKNSVCNDQEASVVLAARTAVDAVGRAWLEQPVRPGRARVIDALDRALDWEWRERRDEASGLLWSGHTVDWGDVSSEFPDQRAIALTPGTPRVLGVYTQAMAHGAALALASLWHGLDAASEARWRERAQALREKAVAALWDEARGQFTVHRHLTAAPHRGFDEAEAFALGGNVAAVRLGLATPAQAARIFDRALERTRALGVSTVSGVMLPPYPAGTFTHDQVDEPYEYQNGGQWDWHGGRLVLALFPSDPEAALAALEDIARKDLGHGGFFEWDTRSGEGRGSPNFTGSAGVLGQAVVEGLFGVDWRGDDVVLAPRLGARDGYLSLLPPGGPHLALRKHGRSYELEVEPPLKVHLRLVLSAGDAVSLDGVGLTVAERPAGFVVELAEGRHEVVVARRR
ncbi:MAG: hypothetical protein K1X89_27595 [Myxococcaceae bacterium]|nr:hypothetical protein [Myxococcaceae bacterium]